MFELKIRCLAQILDSSSIVLLRAWWASIELHASCTEKCRVPGRKMLFREAVGLPEYYFDSLNSRLIILYQISEHIEDTFCWNSEHRGMDCSAIYRWDSKDSSSGSFYFSVASCFRRIAGREIYFPPDAILSDELLSLTIHKSTTTLQ